MPRADAALVKRWLQDHDSDIVNEAPPVQNTWYEVFHAEDVRLIWCVIQQNNDETVNKDVEVRWTIDGTVYFRTYSLPHNTPSYVYRNYAQSGGGTAGLVISGTVSTAARYTDKRGLDFKVEVRLTGVPGTNQTLQAWCVRETLEIT